MVSKSGKEKGLRRFRHWHGAIIALIVGAALGAAAALIGPHQPEPADMAGSSASQPQAAAAPEADPAPPSGSVAGMMASGGEEGAEATGATFVVPEAPQMSALPASAPPVAPVTTTGTAAPAPTALASAQAEANGAAEPEMEEKLAPGLAVTEPPAANHLPPLPPGAHPRIAVIIDDMGVDYKRSQLMAALHWPLTLSYLPYATRVSDQTRSAAANGHEIMLHLPTQPLGPANPGPNALTVSLSPQVLHEKLLANLDAFSGYVGVNNHMGSRFTADSAHMAPVLEEVARRGLFFIDSKTIGNSVGRKVAERIGMMFAERDVFIDDDMSPAKVEGQLAIIERVARKYGSAIAIGHPHDVTREALEAWLPTLKGKGFELVPASVIVQMRSHQPAQLSEVSAKQRGG
ncbi:divergent polysaccharide deacetylase family protein [Radicibacter daui]|uniref:divergent polysaccharide deacetylase family protein n=1 Tax=Radicibacter daui TaxID=3064829 RepID=UPI004046E452